MPMRIKAVSFDIGHTLVSYKNPLNWKSLYAPALRQVSRRCALSLSSADIRTAEAILTGYNTRENPREKEVMSTVIFAEILDALKLPCEKLDAVRESFYGFFDAGAACYPDAADTLGRLRSAGMRIGALTDVAYGMDNAFSLRDIAPIRHFFDAVLTSVDVGYRKPNAAGFLALLKALGVPPAQMIYVGDEQKDIVGANALGIHSVLIDRSGAFPDWGQEYAVQSLGDIPALI